MIALDCTFRDGGYYNNWQFNLALVNRYLTIMEQTKINAIEIGFRSPPNKEVGRFAKVTDEFIKNNLYIPNVQYFGVMINTSEMNSNLIKELFQYQDNSPINMVRMATHFKDVDLAESISKDLKNLGYFTTCNLMQAADKSFDEIKNASKKINTWNSIDVLYLGDSLGGMNQDSVSYSFEAIKEGWDGLTGFHGHNNKGQALINSLEAVDSGVEFIDSTIMGMGRGAGNTETEYLLPELNKRGFGEFELENLYDFVLFDFIDLKKQYNWGPSLPYFLAAEYNIHPTYIQELYDYCYQCGNDNFLKSINFLKDKKSSSFNKELLMESVK